LPLFCEKIKKNAFFLLKYFAVSKKSSTFAPLFRRRVFRSWQKVKRPASLAQLARARDL
jgi:hypothetical protein